MACFRPVTVWKPLDGGRVHYREMANCREIVIPCGRCIGCRIERRDAWAVRCYAESKMHEHNHFLTLSYDNDHIPVDCGLSHRDWQLFAKRLRKKLGPFRYFMCGEYGDRTKRPHYHALLFGLDIPDLVKSNSVYSTHDVYDSEMLRSCWGKGFISIGEVNMTTARYVASYVCKRSKNNHDGRYDRVVDATGEVLEVMPEYGKMSLKPGIGATWFEKYWQEVATHNGVYVANRKVKIPQYFDTLFERMYPDEFIASKLDRMKEAERYIDNNTRERLSVREECATAKERFNRERSNHAL